jgi:hypothetical protein
VEWLQQHVSADTFQDCCSLHHHRGSVQNKERLESGKAAAIALVGGAVGWLPSGLTLSGPLLATALSGVTGLVSCALFGVVYRYGVSADESNPQLKGGAVAAFGLARGLALAADALSGGQEWTPEVLAGAALLTGQSMLMFAFAALALETATARGALKRFGEAG